jgi:anionic cell wall polymer biosynthesis LytR-Cps2A-Psr (LCP) family protein
VVAGGLLLAVVVPGGAMAAPPDPGAILREAGETLRDLGSGITRAADRAVAGSLGSCSRRSGLRLGSDGRLTILLLGSDYRRSPYIGERMDTILVVTRRPSGRVAMAGIPRDTSQFPRAGWNGGGTSGSTRVNALYYGYKRTGLFGIHEVDCRALNRFRADVAAALGTEIDHYAMVRMLPMAALVDSVGFIRVDVPGPIIDTYMGRGGIFFPDRDDYRLVGHERCLPRPAFCRSALSYVRSRAGSEAGRPNSDFRRAYRQQDVVLRTAQRVVERGGGPELRALVRRIRGKVHTDLPTTMEAARTLLGLVGSSRFAADDGIVFAPAGWAYADASTPAYSFRLRLPQVRAWIDRHFGS